MAVSAPAALARPADCLLVVNAREIIRGRCEFEADRDGSFTIAGLNGQYFATVLIERKGVAQGYWNGEPYAGRAHTPLGRLYRQDACWVNDIASVCAW